MNNHINNKGITNMRKPIFYGLLFTALSLFSLSAFVQAALIEVSYTGSTTSVGPNLTGTFSVGDSVQGKLVYDTTTAPTFVSSTDGTYAGAIQSFELTIGTYAASATGTIYTSNDAPTWGDRVYFLGNADVTGAQVGGIDLTRIQLLLNTQVLTTFTDVDLPSVSDLMDLWAVNIAAGNVNFMEFNGLATDDVRYSLTNVTAKVLDGDAVPEPATVALIGLGIAGIGYGRRKQIKAA